MVSRDAKLAAFVVTRHLSYSTDVWDMAAKRLVRELAVNASSLESAESTFSPDGKAIVAGVASKGGNSLEYQPIDGSAVHLLTNPTSEAITSFAWSPSGSKLGLLQLRQSSDVVLITDLTGKQPH